LRTQFIYNNHLYTALGAVVTRVSGQPWRQFVTQRIFQPLAMDSTTSSATSANSARIALRHWRSDDGIVARALDDGMYSTVRDLAQWLKLQLAEGTYDGRQLLQPETVREMHSLQFSTPVRSPPRNNVYAAQFFGSGLGWTVQDYRGRKVVSHAGAWGAIVAMMPDERLGVVVLSNLDLEYLCSLLMYDVFDAYLVGPQAAWLRNEPPGAAHRPRDEARDRLEKSRATGTHPSLLLEKYAGTYNSKLYGPLVVRNDEGRLSVTFGAHTTRLSHWQGDSFYVRSPTRLTFDWLLTFAVNASGGITTVTVKHIGWDQDEKDHAFVRIAE
jgi:CubicO group peptidase (beta-lactamase class C family)